MIKITNEDNFKINKMKHRLKTVGWILLCCISNVICMLFIIPYWIVTSKNLADKVDDYFVDKIKF